MSDNYLSITDSFDKAWSKFKQKALFFVGVTALSMFISMIGQSDKLIGINHGVDMANHQFTLFSLVGMILSSYLGLGIWKICIKHLRGQEVELNDLLSISLSQFVHYIIATIISGIAIMIGMLLLIIPGIHISCRLMLVPGFIVDKNESFDTALKSSWEATKGYSMKIFLWYLLAMLVMLAGFLALVVGIFAAAPVISIAMAYIYIKLTD
jgi:hypothetical protein